jgi:hypothetical protein
VDTRLERTGEEYPFQKARVIVPVVAAMALATIIAFLSATDTSAFIYFQF